MRFKLSFLTILFSMVSIMAIGQVIGAAPPPPPPPLPPSEEIFMVVEQMPEFRGCETVSDKEERKQCAQEALLTYVYSNLVYPPKAKENGQEGMAVVSFVVEKDGTLVDIEVMRDPGSGMGEAAAAVIHKMHTENIAWNPGTQHGKAVAVRFNLPVQFKLDKKEIPTPEEEEEAIEEEMEITAAEIPPPPAPKPMLARAAVVEKEVQVDQSWTSDTKEEVEIEEAPDMPVVAEDKNYPPPPPPLPLPPGKDLIFKVVQDMPHYGKAECEEMATKNEKQECAKEAMLSFIYGNLQYPPLAKENSVEGTVVVTFVVELDGSLSGVRVLRDIGAGCGQEAIRLVELMSAKGQWIPGKQLERSARVQYNLPIKFRLDN